MLLNVITYPNKFLRTKGKAVQNILAPETQEFIADLKETMLKKDGVGLAARQVGRDENIFVVNSGSSIMTFINAKIVFKSLNKAEFEEGCLSVPEVYGMVKRSKSILISYYDELGQYNLKKFSKLPSIVIQHEHDHNKGILFIDKVNKYTSGYENIKDVKE
ncbi:peptide deformylase [Patescibacteria group bacterium]|nr:peptide deformylase [Patescibacteria group bacterium]